MKRRIIFLVISVVIVTAYISRVVYINTHSLAPEIVTYKTGDTVPIEDDFFDSSSEKMNGYSITVLETNLRTMDDFQSEYVDYSNEMHGEYIYLIKVIFRNDKNELGENAGINLAQYMLQETSYINLIDREAYGLINDFDSLTFSLRPDSEMEFVIPFRIDSTYIDADKLKSGNPELVVLLYPHKKMIELN
jgi:hypothetical protein